MKFIEKIKNYEENKVLKIIKGTSNIKHFIFELNNEIIRIDVLNFYLTFRKKGNIINYS